MKKIIVALTVISIAFAALFGILAASSKRVEPERIEAARSLAISSLDEAKSLIKEEIGYDGPAGDIVVVRESGKYLYRVDPDMERSEDDIILQVFTYGREWGETKSPEARRCIDAAIESERLYRRLQERYDEYDGSVRDRYVKLTIVFAVVGMIGAALAIGARKTAMVVAILALGLAACSSAFKHEDAAKEDKAASIAELEAAKQYVIDAGLEPLCQIDDIIVYRGYSENGGHTYSYDVRRERSETVGVMEVSWREISWHDMSAPEHQPFRDAVDAALRDEANARIHAFRTWLAIIVEAILVAFVAPEALAHKTWVL